MRRLLLLVLSLVSCCCSGHLYKEPPRVAATQTLDVIYDATVALVHRHDDGTYGAYCTGVWVDEHTILTAYHCALAYTLSEAEEVVADEFGFTPDVSGRLVRSEERRV